MLNECIPTDLSNIGNIRTWFRVGLLGPYTKRKRLLTGGRYRLRREGFPFSFLIEDFPDMGFSSMREKSKYYFKSMNLVFFTFAFRCDNSGVAIELDDFVKSKKHPQIQGVAMIEIDRDGRTPVSTLSKENITKGTLTKVHFSTDEEFLSGLSNAAHRCAYGFLKKLGSSLAEKILFLESILNNPVYNNRLCDVHRKNFAAFVCVARCPITCRISHLCYADVLTGTGGTVCQRQKRPVFRICPPSLPAIT